MYIYTFTFIQSGDIALYIQYTTIRILHLHITYVNIEVVARLSELVYNIILHILKC